MQHDYTAQRMSATWQLHYAKVLATLGETDLAREIIERVINNTGYSLEHYVLAINVLIFMECFAEAYDLLNQCTVAHEHNTEFFLRKSSLGHTILLRKYYLIWENIQKQLAKSTPHQASFIDQTDERILLIGNCAEYLQTGDHQHNQDKTLTLLEHTTKAYLSVAEDHWRNGSTDQAVAVLHNHLTLLAVHDKSLRSLIIEGIHHVRNPNLQNQAALDHLVDTLRTIDPDTLPCNTWRCLYDVLIWNKLYHSAFFAWQQGIYKACKDADRDPKNIGFAVRAIRAAIAIGAFEQAEHYIDSIKKIDGHIKRIEHIVAYYYLNSGQINHAQSILFKNRINRDNRYAEFIRGKSIAIVGPAQTDELCGDDIDRFDVVIRINFDGIPYSDEQAPYVGSRTDISYVLPQFLLANGSAYCQNIHPKIQFSVISTNLWSPSFSYLLDGLKDQSIRQIIMLQNNYFYKSPNAIQRILLDLYHFEPKKIKIFKTNFYLANITYQKNYMGRSYSDKANQAHFPPQSVYSHGAVGQLALTKNLWANGGIEADNDCSRVLEMSLERYMFAMQDLALKARLINK
jgi:hypothetical protein